MPLKKVLNKRIADFGRINPVYVVLVVSFILRLISINQSLWLDEATVANTVNNFSLVDIVIKFSRNDFHPPLYYLVIKLTSLVLGTSEIALRIPSVVFGVLTVFGVYKIGKELKDKSTGLIAAILLATNPLHIYYSQEARMYALAGMFAVVSVYFLLRAVNGKTNKYWIFLSISLVCLVFTDYLASLMIVPLFIFVFLNHRRSMKAFVLTLVPVILLFCLYLPTFTSQLTSGLAVRTNSSGWWQILGQSNVKNILLIPSKFLTGRINFDSKVIYGVLVTGLFLMSGLTIFKVFKENKNRLLVFWLLVPITLSLLIGLFVPVVTYFRFLFCLPALILLTGLGISGAREKHFLPLLFFFLFSNLFFSYRYLSNSQFQREDWKGLVKTISEDSSEKIAATVFVANSQMEAYQYYRSTVEAIPGEMFNGSKDIVWLMRYVQDVFDPEDQTRQKIERLGYQYEKEFNFNGIVVWKYISP